MVFEKCVTQLSGYFKNHRGEIFLDTQRKTVWGEIFHYTWTKNFRWNFIEKKNCFKRNFLSKLQNIMLRWKLLNSNVSFYKSIQPTTSIFIVLQRHWLIQWESYKLTTKYMTNIFPFIKWFFFLAVEAFHVVNKSAATWLHVQAHWKLATVKFVEQTNDAFIVQWN